MDKKLYLLYQDKVRGYDTYDSVVVCATSIHDAKRISPSPFYTWNEPDDCWHFQYTNGGTKKDNNSGWANRLSDIKVKYIGIADESTDIGVVCASFNAG